MREDAGRSQASVATAARLDRAHVSRIEAGTAQPSVAALMAIAAALGADLSIRLFPNTGPRLRDRLQVAISEGLIAALHPRWRVTPEFPVYRPVRGIIDLVLTDTAGADLVAVEIHSQLRRVEQQIRWARQKADGLAALPHHERRRIHRLLLLLDTAAMREVARLPSETLRAAYPAPTSGAVAGLRGSAPWPGDTIVWANVTSGEAHLLERPPRAVSVGR